MDKVLPILKKSKHKHRISGCDNTKEGEQKIPDNLPFLLTKAELKIADQRAENIRVPVGFGLKPSSFISSSVKLADYSFMTGSNWRPMGLFLFCLKDTLEKRCRDTLYLLFDYHRFMQ